MIQVWRSAPIYTMLKSFEWVQVGPSGSKWVMDRPYSPA